MLPKIIHDCWFGGKEETKEVRVTFVCFTTYQLINAYYYANKIKKISKLNVALVWMNGTNFDIPIDCVSENFDSIQNLTDTDSLTCKTSIKKVAKRLLHEGHLFPFSKLGREYKKTSKREILICFSDQHTISRRLIDYCEKNGVVLEVEEGASTYTMQSDGPMTFFEKMKYLLLGYKTESYIGNCDKIAAFIVRFPELMPKEKVRDRTLVLQNNIFIELSWQQEILNKINSISSDLKTILCTKKIILWLGQPNEMADKNTDYLQMEKELILNIAKCLTDDYVLLIKRHPRESLSKYEYLNSKVNTKLVELGSYNWIPIELLSQKIQPDIVISVWSSAVVNIVNIVNKAKGIFVYPLLPIKIDSAYFKLLCENSNCSIVYDIEKLKNIIYNEPIVNTVRVLEQNKNQDINFLKALIGSFENGGNINV